MADLHESVAFAPGSHVLGDVAIGEDSSVWYNAVIRADEERVRIGRRTNIQDNAVVHVSEGHAVELGDDVTVGHGAIVHGCSVGDGTLIGMGAVVLDGARIGSGCIVGAGSLVPMGTVIPDGSVAFGNPVAVRRAMTDADKQANLRNAACYVKLAKRLREG